MIVGSSSLVALWAISLHVGGSYAWGSMAHRTVALIAENYLDDATDAWINEILGTSDEISDVASWADSYRYEDEGEFSAAFHYIDALDAPPDTCGVTYSRDCGDEGCVVSAIANYTSIVQDTSASDEERENALKFIVHFLGDITQPLHCDSLDGTGGNTIDVEYNGASTNLHSAWDTAIPQAISGGSSNTYSTSWSKTLITAIDSGIYKSVKASWITCTDISDAIGCATEWADDSNQYVCSAVVPDGVEAIEGEDLSTGTYNTNAKTVAALQVAKGGYRLAAWLNELAAAA